MLKLEDMVKLDPRYKTIFEGLKLNSVHNSAVTYPLMFLLRRVIIAGALVFLSHQPQLQALLILITSLCAIIYTTVER